MRNFLNKSYDADNLEIHSSDENKKIVHDVITLRGLSRWCCLRFKKKNSY